MALARIDVIEGWPPDRKLDMLRGVRDALVNTLNVPHDDPTLHLFEAPREHAILPGSASDAYVLISITMFAGRSIETKRRLVAAVTEAVCALGPEPSEVDVVLHEPAVENWARAGVLASPDKIGFKIDI